MRLLQAIQELKPDIQWEYNFFPAYHGCNVCDAAASHAKKKINDNSRNYRQSIGNPKIILEKINQLTNHQATSISTSKQLILSKTFKNITK